MSTVVAAAVTDVGAVRPHNEDSYLVDAEAQIFAVADGMGGHAAGEVASAIAVTRVREVWNGVSMRRRLEAYAESGDPRARRALLQAVREGVMDAHLEIVNQAREDETKRGMGTTFTGFLVAGGDAVFAHAGDSRAYLVRDGIAMQLSEDHTILARLRAAGMDPVEEGVDPRRWKGVITNALGLGDATRVATFIIPLYSGDRFLLCSDGVYEYLGEAEIGRVMVEAPSPARAANRFVELAVERGGADNATAVVVKVVEAGKTTVPPEQRDRDAAALGSCPLFEMLTPQERLRALRITTTRELKGDKEILPMALGSRVAYVVLDGEVAGPRGETLSAGQILYPEALVDGTRMSDDIASTRGTARLLTIRRDDFVELTEEEAELGVKLYAVLAKLMAK